MSLNFNYNVLRAFYKSRYSYNIEFFIYNFQKIIRINCFTGR